MDSAANNILRFSLILGSAILALFYVLAIAPYWKVTPDSALYVAAAKSLAAGHGYTINAQPVILYPPVTSLIFSAPFLIFPDSYLPLRVAVTVSTLLSIYLCFLLLKLQDQNWRAGVVAILSLGSVYLFNQSTQLLSDTFYMLFSISGLWILEKRRNQESGRGCVLLAALMILAACMTRIIGLTLPLAVIAYTLAERFKRKSQFDYSVVTLMGLALLSVGLWEYRNATMGLSFFKLLAQNEPWVEEGGYISLFGLAGRFFTNLTDFSALGAMLTNNIGAGFFHHRFAQLVLLLLAGLIFGIGLYASLSRKLAISPIYAAFYIVSVELYHPEIELRWLIPVLPFLFYYTLEGLEYLWAKFPAPLSFLCRSAAVAYMLCYLGYGLSHMVSDFSAEHRSPFGSFPIKYAANYDEQRLAMWMSQHVPLESAYVCQHPLIMDLLTQRKGHLFPLSRDPNRLLDLLTRQKINYVLVNKTKVAVQQFLLPVIAQNPAKFHLIKEEPKASLYEFAL